MTVKPAKIYPFTIGAYEALPIMVQGSYFKILSATGMVDVTGDTFGTVEAMLAGQGLRGQDFRRLVIRDRSGSPNMVRLLVSDDQFIDDRITGEVSVVDGNKARSVAGGAMTWRLSTASVGANGRPLSQIWNPAGTGRRIIIDALVVACDIQNEMFWGQTATRLTTVPASRIAAAQGMAVPSTVAEAWVQEMVGYPADTVIAGGLMVQPWSSVRVRFERPFVVQPGNGFIVGVGLGGVQKTAGEIEFFEESIL